MKTAALKLPSGTSNPSTSRFPSDPIGLKISEGANLRGARIVKFPAPLGNLKNERNPRGKTRVSLHDTRGIRGIYERRSERRNLRALVSRSDNPSEILSD